MSKTHRPWEPHEEPELLDLVIRKARRRVGLLADDAIYPSRAREYSAALIILYDALKKKGKKL